MPVLESTIEVLLEEISSMEALANCYATNEEKGAKAYSKSYDLLLL